MFATFWNQTATIQRTSTSSGKQVYANVATSVACRVEALSDSASAVNEFEFGQGFRIFFDAAQTMYPNDLVVIGSTTYKVRGVKNQSSGSLSHVECLAEVVVKS